jgi:hypothetical protein
LSSMPRAGRIAAVINAAAEVLDVAEEPVAA